MNLIGQQIGGRLRALRLERGLTLDERAAQTGFTKSYLSKIENSRKIPPIGTLAQICRALATDLAFFFQSPDEEQSEAGAGICVVRANERRPAVRGGTTFGYDYENLAHRLAQKHMEPFLFTFPTNVGEEVYFEHEGEEFIFVINGRVRFVVDTREWVLGPGDSIYFDSSRPHRGEALGGEAKALVVIYTPDGRAEERLPHLLQAGRDPSPAFQPAPARGLTHAARRRTGSIDSRE